MKPKPRGAAKAPRTSKRSCFYVNLNDAEHARLKESAQRNLRTIQQEVRLALRDYLNMAPGSNRPLTEEDMTTAFTAWLRSPEAGRFFNPRGRA